MLGRRTPVVPRRTKRSLRSSSRKIEQAWKSRTSSATPMTRSMRASSLRTASRALAIWLRASSRRAAASRARTVPARAARASARSMVFGPKASGPVALGVEDGAQAVVDVADRDGDLGARGGEERLVVGGHVRAGKRLARRGDGADDVALPPRDGHPGPRRRVVRGDPRAVARLEVPLLDVQPRQKDVPRPQQLARAVDEGVEPPVGRGLRRDLGEQAGELEGGHGVKGT